MISNTHSSETYKRKKRGRKVIKILIIELQLLRQRIKFFLNKNNANKHLSIQSDPFKCFKSLVQLTKKEIAHFINLFQKKRNINA